MKNLSDKFSDLKIYSRSKYSDGLPLTSTDVHGDEDNLFRKLGILINSLSGSGLLERPYFNTSTDSDSLSIRLSSPISLNLNGDIFLAGNSHNIYPVTLPANYTGSLVLVCWYTKLISSDIEEKEEKVFSNKLYEYGGLCNNEMPNDILDTDLKVQTSSKYQIRWNLGYCSSVLDYSNPVIQDITVVNQLTTEAGNYSNLLWSSSSMKMTGKFYTVPSTTRVPSADGFIHLIPLANIQRGMLTSVNVPSSMYSIESSSTPSPTYHKIWYNPSNDDVKMFFNGAWRNVGGSNVIKQEVEPTNNLKDGIVWYNTKEKGFNIYIEGVGFVPTFTKYRLLSHQYIDTAQENMTNEADVSIQINIPTNILSTDIIRVTYEGLELIPNTDYTVNTSTKIITLKGFNRNIGEKLVITLIRLEQTVGSGGNTSGDSFITF